MKRRLDPLRRRRTVGDEDGTLVAVVATVVGAAGVGAVEVAVAVAVVVAVELELEATAFTASSPLSMRSPSCRLSGGDGGEGRASALAAFNVARSLARRFLFLLLAALLCLSVPLVAARAVPLVPFGMVVTASLSLLSILSSLSVSVSVSVRLPGSSSSSPSSPL